MVAFSVRTTDDNRSVLTDRRIFIPFDEMIKNVKTSTYTSDGKCVRAVTYEFEFRCKGAFVCSLFLDDEDDVLTVGDSIYRPSINPCSA